ncbi:glycosyltransferase [Dehalococcoidia bacterium]|nr:glycosyltransferase [Dehalococcoidia bacterium]
MNYRKVSIIILNWNGLEDTIECLESLKKITYPNYEVIVVDNGSEGNDVEVLQERFGDYIHIIQNDKNYGFCEGNNIAIRWLLDNSQPDYFLLLNNDTVVAPEFLTELVKVAESSPSVGITGPKTYLYDDPNRFWLVWFGVDMHKGRPFHVGSREIDRGQYETIKEVDYIAGSCLLIKRSVVRNVGLFDESYFNYWDETDYCLRVRKGGYKIIYVPKAKIWHKRSQSASRVTGFSSYYLTRNRFWFMKRHATEKQLASFLLWFFLRDFWVESGVHLLYRRDVKTLKSFYRGIKHGILMLLRTDQGKMIKLAKILVRNAVYLLHYLNFIKTTEARIVSKFLQPKRGERILDIACGSGIQSMKMAKRGSKVYGIDMNERTIFVAKVITEGTGAIFQIGNAEALPYQSGVFDKIVCVCSLEHFKDDEKALAEMNRVLKIGGILVLTVDSFTYNRGIKNHLQATHAHNHHVVNYYSDSELTQKLRKAGFEVEETKYFISSPISAFLFNLGIRLSFGVLFPALFPIAYPLSVISDHFFGRKNEGYLLAMKARKGEQPCGNSI